MEPQIILLGIVWLAVSIILVKKVVLEWYDTWEEHEWYYQVCNLLMFVLVLPLLLVVLLSIIAIPLIIRDQLIESRRKGILQRLNMYERNGSKPS